VRKVLRAAVDRSATFHRGAQVLGHLRRTAQRKPVPRLLLELFACGITNREIPKYYFSRMVYRRDAKNYLDFLSDREIAIIEAAVHDPERVPFFKNKVLFHHHLSGSGIPLPKQLGYNLGERFFSPEGGRPLESLASFHRLVDDLLATSASSSIFVKPVDGTGGRRCERIDSTDADCGRLGAIYETIRSGNFVFQETIVQHPLVSAIYPHSVNTLRFTMCIGRGGEIRFVFPTMRFGTNGSTVDNVGSGGVGIEVDAETGTLGPYARQFFPYGDASYVSHPDTGFTFAGTVIPHFQAALETAKAAAAVLPYRLIGWDIAITAEGPVLVEGNNKPDLPHMDVFLDGSKGNPAFAAYLNELLDNHG
jgi:Sugar-transfer associated ATP-grasp